MDYLLPRGPNHRRLGCPDEPGPGRGGNVFSCDSQRQCLCSWCSPRAARAAAARRVSVCPTRAAPATPRGRIAQLDANGSALLAKGKRSPSPTETCNAWYERFKRHRRNEVGSVEHDAWRREKWIAPRIGTKPIVAVTPDDIEDIRDALTAAVLAYEAAGNEQGEGRLRDGEARVCPVLAATAKKWRAGIFREHITLAKVDAPAFFVETATHLMIDFRSLRDSGTWRFLAEHRAEVVQREAGREYISTTLGYAKEVQDRRGRYGTPFPALPSELTDDPDPPPGPLSTPTVYTSKNVGEIEWSNGGSNPGPPHCERGALPAELLPQSHRVRARRRDRRDHGGGTYAPAP